MSANVANPTAEAAPAPLETRETEPRPRMTPATLLWGIVPLLLLAGVVVWILNTNGGMGHRTTPPIETLDVERVFLPAPNEIRLQVVNSGPDPITIAQVMVDDAYWAFSMEPAGTIDRLQSATITIPYPWVEAEGHAIGLISSTGVLFPAEIPVAVASPLPSQESFLRFALVGLYVGIIPVTLGLLWYPFMRRMGRGGMNFVLALTIGLLVFLVVDMWGAANAAAATAAGALDTPVLLPLVALLTMGLLMLLGHALRTRQKAQSAERNPLTLAYEIAFSIGLHNMGEGLAIGAAFALGEAALGAFLILGFTLHNVTEGIGIAAPLVKQRPPLAHFAGLALVAGTPAILGIWIGAFVYSPFWTAIFLAIGIGAILQVIVEVSRMIQRSQQRANEPVLSWNVFAGAAAGIALMYLTALLVAA